jgi:hypothetical protein
MKETCTWLLLYCHLTLFDTDFFPVPGFLLPSALARVHLEGFKAPRRETNTADGYGKRTRTRCLGRQVGDRTLWVIVSTGAFLLLLL